MGHSRREKCGRPSWLAIRRLVFLWVLFASLSTSLAGSGGFTSITYGKPSRGNALLVEFDNIWVAGDGYRPVRIRIRPIGKPKFKRDRQVTIQLNHFENWTEFPREMTYRTIDLPEGVREVTTTVYAYQNRIQSKFEFEIWEGRRGTRNVMRTRINERSAQVVWNEAAPCLLIVDSDLPRLADRVGGQDQYRGQVETNPDGLDGKLPKVANFVLSVAPMWPAGFRQKGKIKTELSWVDISDDIPTCEYMAPADLSASWLGLSGIDIFYISLDDLKGLNHDLPQQWTSLTNWIRNGGMIWISGVGEGLAKVSEVEELLSLQPELGRGSDWLRPKTQIFKDRLTELEPQTQYQWNNGQYVAPVSDEFEMPEDIGKPRSHFGIRRLQMGKVVAWEADDPFASNERWFWEWTLKVMGTDTWMWSERHGFSTVRTNDSFWEFLIPGVGLAPVNTFRVVITLFVLTIGPLNFMLLKRWKRLNWMLFTVPACAILVTFSLTNYALLTDGISVKSRFRSLTMVDQVAGQATTWSRQSYYAGLAPSNGLVFPDDAAVYPLDYDPLARMGNSGRPRRVSWDNSQNLALGYLSSRSTAQFIVQRSRESSMGLRFPDGMTAPSRVKNELRGDILQLILTDEVGTIFVSSNIAEGTEAEMEVWASDVDEWTREWVLSNEPEVPEGVELGMIQNTRSVRWQYRSSNNHLGDPQMDTNRANRIIRDHFGKLAPRRYIAILETCAEVPRGVESSREFESFYMVIGEY